MRRRTTQSKPSNTTPKTKAAPSVKVELPPEETPAKRQTGGVDTRASRVEFTGYENIIDSLFTFDPEKARSQVEECLQFSKKASRMEYGELVDALGEAQENSKVALQLVAHSEAALVNFKSDVETILADIREKAVEEMMGEGDEGDEDGQKPKPKKKPTIADIDAYMRSTYHDELSAANDRLAKGKQMVGYFNGLAKVVAERARDLRQMVSSCRGV